MVTESIDKVKLPDQRYLGLWLGDTVVLPFVGYDIMFDVFDCSDSEILSWVIVADGLCLVQEKV